MKEILYLLIDKKDLTKKFDKKVDLFTLNEFVISEFEKKNFNHFFPKPKETSILSESLIYKIKKTKIELYKKIRELYIFNQIEDGSLKARANIYFKKDNKDKILYEINYVYLKSRKSIKYEI